MKNFFSIVGIIIILSAICLLLPWEHVNWGKISILPAPTITVSGEAKANELPQIAHFSASVTVTNQDKQASVNKVNQTMAKLIQLIKDFGINEKDIQTQQLSVYQGKNNWQASNSIRVTLRDITKASALADLLQGSEFTNVSGPSYSLDDTAETQVALLSKAIDNAREKAAKIATASKRKLGKVITVSEGGSSYPRPLSIGGMMAEKSVSAPVEPGTETIYQSVTVTFALK